MDKEALTTFLLKSNFITLSAANEIADKFIYKSIPKNQFQLSEGKVSDEYLLLQKGYMRAFAHDTEGNDITTGFYTPGQVIFEVASFFNRTRSKENIQALTDCEGWYITYMQLNALFHAMPQFREFGRSILVQGFSELKTRMLITITETAEARYEHLLKSSPDIFHHAPLKNIATYLGITDTSLSRIRKDFARK